jgi:glycosyltransferase involved in cell wall biosynthesis
VHTNWLAGAVVAALCGKPFVVTLHGSPTAGRMHDLGLAARAPRLVRWVLGRARIVICCSERLATAMRGCGLTNVRAIPYRVHAPDEVGDEDEPPSVLYIGRLSPEKNIDVIAEATEGLPRIVTGDGPIRHLLPDTICFVGPAEVSKLYGRAAVVVVASSAEGLPNVVLEAMAHGKTVVATPVGGIPTVIEDSKTGLLVPVRDAVALRAAIEKALGDRELRRRLGSAARKRVDGYCSWNRVTDATLAVHAAAVPDAARETGVQPVVRPAVL